MEALNSIFTRRSIRKYTNEKPTEKQVVILLKAGMCAQNTINKRTWAFIVIRDNETIGALSKGLTPNAIPLQDTPLAIVVCGDLSLCTKGLEGYWVQDCSNAATHILLAAHAIGLGGVWYGTYPQEYKVKNVMRTLNLAEYCIPLCVLGIGYPDEIKSSDSIIEERYEKDKIHYNKWGGK